MKKQVARVFSVIVVGLVIVGAYFFIDRFVIGAVKAEEKIDAYEQAQYMHAEYLHPEKTDMKYDWYSGSGYIGDGYRYNPKRNLILDEKRNELWRQYFVREMDDIEAGFETNVLIEDYSLITYYDGDDANIRYDDLFIYGVYHTQPVKEDERMDTAIDIVGTIINALDIDYNICGIHIDYYDLNGVYRFSLDLGKEKITKEMLAECVREVPFEDNLLIEEKWQVFCAKREEIWSFPVENYEIALMGMQGYGDYQLVQKIGEEENVLKTYNGQARNPEEYQYGTFEDILGYNGFYVYEVVHYFSYGDYYVIEDGKLRQIAHSWGTMPKDCYVVDVNEDGISEFICNVFYGTGGEDAIIYYNDGREILTGSLGDLAEIDEEKVISKSYSAKYLVDQNVVEVQYMLSNSADYIVERHEVELEKINWYPFVESR